MYHFLESMELKHFETTGNYSFNSHAKTKDLDGDNAQGELQYTWKLCI